VAKNMTDKKKPVGRGQIAATGDPSTRSRATKAEKIDEAVKTSARETTRREPAKQESRSVNRKSTKESTSKVSRFRNHPIVRFLFESSYELRFKVTWPTFREARTMTAVVVALSAAIGAVLATADFGLHRLFLLIIGAN
jgi:preprotein translocase SecE subunit